MASNVSFRPFGFRSFSRLLQRSPAVYCLTIHGGEGPFVVSFNPYSPEQNCRRFAGDIFRCHFMNEKFCVLISISLQRGKCFHLMTSSWVPGNSNWHSSQIYCPSFDLITNSCLGLTINKPPLNPGHGWFIVLQNVCPYQWRWRFIIDKSNHIPQFYVDVNTHPCQYRFIFDKIP